jgi:hypothetical protein
MFMTHDYDIGYGSEIIESNELVPLFRWRLLLAGFTATIIGCVVLTILLANGIANPPRAAFPIGNLPSDESFDPLPAYDGADQLLRRVPRLAGMPASPPLTLEATAKNEGENGSAWGFWIDNRRFIVDNQGYASCTDARGQAGWFEFIHLLPQQANTLYLHIDPFGNATFRINGEIACEVLVPPTFSQWGTLHYHQPQLQWTNIQMFAGIDSL